MINQMQYRLADEPKIKKNKERTIQPFELRKGANFEIDFAA
jgi:hypothetical protein